MAQLIRKHLTNIMRINFSSQVRPNPLACTLKRNLQTSRALQKLVIFNFPDFGPPVTEAAIKEWLVEPGQIVSQGENICQMVTDIVDLTIPSPYNGIILEFEAEVGDVVTAGDPLAAFEVADDEMLRTPSVQLIARIDDQKKNSAVHTVVALKSFSKTMNKSMTEALKIPHFSYSEEVDMSKLVSVRDDIEREAGSTLTFMPFLIKAASICLYEYPILNSSFDAENESIIYKHHHNITIAILTPLGLVMPNIKSVCSKSILQISNDLMSITERSLKSDLTPHDFSDGTFTLSNLGGTFAHPVIIPPQVCIGAIGKINVLPRFGKNDEIIKAHIMNVSFSADHRVIDGVTISSFVNMWKQYLEHPSLLLLEH